MAEARPKWVRAIGTFLGDTVVDEAYGYPEDGSADALLKEVEDAVNAIFCRVYGHEVVFDQCMIPEHRFCIWCQRRESDLT